MAHNATDLKQTGTIRIFRALKLSLFTGSVKGAASTLTRILRLFESNHVFAKDAIVVIKHCRRQTLNAAEIVTPVNESINRSVADEVPTHPKSNVPAHCRDSDSAESAIKGFF